MDFKPITDLFEDEIDAFAGTAEDIAKIVHGQPVHTDAQKWAKRIITAATTVIPVGISAKAAVKGVKAAAKGVQATARLSKEKKAADLSRKAQLQREREHLNKVNSVVKPASKGVKRATRVAYYASGDGEARDQRNAAIASIPRHKEELEMAYVSAKKKKRMIKGAAKGTQAALKKMKDKPMDKNDAQVLIQNAAYGALKGFTHKNHKLPLHNDKRWYTQLGTDMVGLNFCHPDKLGPDPNLLKNDAGQAVPVIVSTDAVIDLLLTVPSGCQDPFSIAAAKLGQEMRLHSGANTIYAPEDIQEYLINARSIMAGICQMIRAVKCLNNVDSLDVDAYAKYGMMAIEAYGAARDTRYPELVANGANILTRVNNLIKQARMMIPINMPLMERTEWLFSNFFADGKQQKYSVKEFTAAFLPKATYSTPGDSGGVITIISDDFLVSNSPLAALLYLEQRMASFVTDRIHMAIAGDIMKIYGAGAFWSPALLTGTEAASIIYDEEALTQIQNMTVLCTPTADPVNLQQVITNGVVATTGDLVFTTDSVYTTVTLARRLNYSAYHAKAAQTYKQSLDGGDILELTRLMHTVGLAVDDTDPKTFHITELICGTEIALNYGYLTQRVVTANGQYLDIVEERRMGASAAARARFLTMWSIDDWAPFLAFDALTGSLNILALFDFQNWASVSNEQLRSFHYIAALSLATVKDPVLRPTI